MTRKRRLYSYILLFVFVVLMFPSKALASVAADRIAGTDRFGTAIEISKRGWQVSDNAVLATGMNFPDALCAAPLAEQLDAPILLTQGTSLDTALEEELGRLGVSSVFIVGGEGAVSLPVENALKARHIRVIRISGEDRYKTSLRVAQFMEANSGKPSEIAVATGLNFPDALSIAPVAAVKGMPIILSPKDKLNDGIRAYLDKRDIKSTYVIGGTGVISSGVEGELPGAERIGGNNRYETNEAILERFEHELDFNLAYMATGTNFPDALAGSALAPKTISPIILTGKSPDRKLMDFVASRLSSIRKVIALGGEGAVPYDVMKEMILDVNTQGNTPGNTVTGGIAAVQGDWAFYRDGYSLYKRRLGGTSKTLLSFNDPMFINVIGNWIYYSNLSDSGRIYKIRTDGTDRVRLTEDSAMSLNVVGEWIYYANGSEGDSIYKIKTDGTERMKLNDEPSYDINVEGDFIYYGSGSHGGSLYKVRTDGTGRTEVDNGGRQYITFQYGWIYYLDSDNYSIHKVNAEGTEKAMVSQDSAYFMNISDGWIYYSSLDDGMLYRMRIDGKGKESLVEDYPLAVSVMEDWIYYVSGSDGLMYRMKTDGTGRENI